MQRFGVGLVQILCGFIGNVKERGMLALLPVMDAVIQVGLAVGVGMYRRGAGRAGTDACDGRRDLGRAVFMEVVYMCARVCVLCLWCAYMSLECKGGGQGMLALMPMMDIVI